MNKITMRKYARYLLILPLLVCSHILHANTVSLKISKTINATAEYQPTNSNKPLLIFIHGFLQTRDFSTVKRLSDALYDDGFPTLSPTLSLGISNRKQSLPCESIHLHSLHSDTDEISKWVKWASQQGHKEIILIGHSTGSVNISAYLASGAHPSISKTILISLTYYGPNLLMAFESSIQADNAKILLQKADTRLHKFSLQYCKEYITTAENFLSYYNWSSEQVLKAITTGHTENHIILGSADERMGPQWLNDIHRASNLIITVDGANHFFDQAHEFDLLDSIENILADY